VGVLRDEEAAIPLSACDVEDVFVSAILECEQVAVKMLSADVASDAGKISLASPLEVICPIWNSERTAFQGHRRDIS
jgi:hypothetical protein